MQMDTQKGNSILVNKQGYSEMFSLNTKKCKLKQQRHFENRGCQAFTMVKSNRWEVKFLNCLTKQCGNIYLTYVHLNSILGNLS